MHLADHQLTQSGIIRDMAKDNENMNIAIFSCIKSELTSIKQTTSLSNQEFTPKDTFHKCLVHIFLHSLI